MQPTRVFNQSDLAKRYGKDPSLIRKWWKLMDYLPEPDMLTQGGIPIWHTYDIERWEESHPWLKARAGLVEQEKKK